MFELLVPAGCFTLMLWLVYRERRLYLKHLADANARLVEDAEVAQLEELFDLDWTDAR